MQKGTGSGDIAQKVGEGDERTGGEWEESGIDEWCSVRTWHCVSTIWIGRMDGWMDRQTDTATDARVQLLLQTRQLALRSQQQRGRGRLGKPPQGWRRRRWRWWWCSQSCRRGPRRSNSRGSRSSSGCEARKLRQKVKGGAHVQVARAGGRRVGSAVRRYEYRTCPPRYHATASLCSFLGTVDHRLRYTCAYLGTWPDLPAYQGT